MTKLTAKKSPAKAKTSAKKASARSRDNWGWPSVLGRETVSTAPGIYFRCPPSLKADTVRLMKEIYPHGTKTLAQYIIEAIAEKNQRERAKLEAGEGRAVSPRQKK